MGGDNPFKDVDHESREQYVMQSRGMPDEDTLNLSSLGASATKQRDLERLLLKADERNICKCTCIMYFKQCHIRRKILYLVAHVGKTCSPGYTP